MKSNPTRNWAIQLWGVKDDEHHSFTMLGTIEEAFTAADEAECEVDWEVVRVSMAAQG